MKTDLKNMFRDLLKSVVREVLEELLVEGRLQPHQTSSRLASPREEKQLLFSVRDTAKRLAVSERHLFNLTREGTIPSVRIGRLVHYSVESIERWIRETESNKYPQAKQGSRKEKPTGERASIPGKRLHNSRKKQSISSEPSLTKAKKRSRQSMEKKQVGESAIHHETPMLNPFRKLLKDNGLNTDKLGPLANGELMRIAEVEMTVFHGWMYLGSELPGEALEKLVQHFQVVASTKNANRSKV